MKKLILLSIWIVNNCFIATAQKKPLDHTVYDSWQSVTNLQISRDGKWISYNIDVQEGDGNLVIQSANKDYQKVIPRGYDALFTGDSKGLAFKIKPLYHETRQAKIKKKKPSEMPRDSFAVITLGKEEIKKYPAMVSFKMPEEPNTWVASLLKNEPPKARSNFKPDKSKDSLNRIIDSLNYVITTLKPQKGADTVADEGRNNRLLVMNTANDETFLFPNISSYVFNKKGTKILLHQTLSLSDTNRSARIILYDLISKSVDTLMRGGNDFKNLALSEDGNNAAFVAEREAKPKALKKIYRLWYFKSGMDSAIMLVDTLTADMPKGNTVSEYAKLKFSKSGERLVFGTAAIRPPIDTSLVDIDKVNVDIWNYKDDYLQPYQLENQKRDREQSYTAVYDLILNKMFQIGTKNLPNVYEASESDGRSFLVVTDTGRRIASQWMGNTLKDVYQYQVGKQGYVPVVKNLNGVIGYSSISPSGKYITWYDNRSKNYFVFDGVSARAITEGIKVPLYDEENDVPADPYPYGIMGWETGETSLFLYDRYDIWKVPILTKSLPLNITGTGRGHKITYRYVKTDPEAKYINPAQQNLLRSFDNSSKRSGLAILENGQLKNNLLNPALFSKQAYYFDQIAKAQDAAVYTFTKESYEQSPNVYVSNGSTELKMSETNPHQSRYNWGNAALYTWKTFSGKPATGIIYKPENFDPAKKYPVILYFYEKLSDGLFRYTPPAPTPSRLNISFFVSRGYVVLAPDINYTIGHPAKSAYDYIVSGAKSLTKYPWINTKKMGIQGQSWGGIQVAQLITMTPMFAAAWAGAPVANMTSAYGGIRWKGGVNRQFQYEKTQSRIGATLWQKPELYIENSPLFHLPKVTTPLVIMANDNDGAVPWYQGIELFTGLRRLGKPVWMLNYNGEEHNLVARKNRKDISIREQQFFDWLLKGEKAPKWITEGVPAVDKGNDWGLELIEQ